jgi:hypothetical protein
VATDKDKGLVGGATDIVGGATNAVRETTSAGRLGGRGLWHSANSDVYHNNPNCQTVNSIAPRMCSGEPATNPFAENAKSSTVQAAP